MFLSQRKLAVYGAANGGACDSVRQTSAFKPAAATSHEPLFEGGTRNILKTCVMEIMSHLVVIC